MEFRRIGKSGLKVSAVGLGANNFGGRATEKASVEVINRALELGINFIDTSASYAEGRSEEILGKTLNGKRVGLTIATKFGNPRSVATNQLPGSRSHVMQAVEGSLRRLNTDYIDIFYFHYPDLKTPIEETLRALDDLVRSGKVRYIACSNFAAWQLSDAIWTSRLLNLNSFIAVQSRYNLLDRSIEKELVPFCEAHDIGVIPWGPLASGFLTGKYEQGKAIPLGTRFARSFQIYDDVMTPANFDKLSKLKGFAEERGHNVEELAMGWLLSHPWLGSVIAGAMSAEQLSENVAAANWELTAEDIVNLDKII